jgi:hypothetical protein
MDEEEIKELLKSGKRSVRRGWRCPDENQLAAYFVGELDAGKRKSFETHVADCRSCLGAIAFLAQSAGQTNLEAVPPHVLSRARNLVSAKPPTVWRWRWAMATAAAACVIFIVALIALRFRDEQTPTLSSGPLVAQEHQPEPALVQPLPSIQSPRATPTISIQKPKSTEAQAPSIRGGAEELKPTLVTPRDGAVLKRDQLQFRWRPVAGAAFYEVKVVTAEGGSVFQGRASDSQLTLSNDVEVQPAPKYFVTIVAHLSDGQTLRSNPVGFRLASR